jgi:hypothetical protein
MRTTTAILFTGALAAFGLVFGAAACGGASFQGNRAEELDTSSYPADIQASYKVTAQRCSKCHSLARVWDSGITDDDYWVRYVERMRHQPGSGITRGDESVILHFLFYYSAQKRDAAAAKTAANP